MSISIQQKLDLYSTTKADLEAELANPDVLKDQNAYRKISKQYDDIKRKWQVVNDIVDTEANLNANLEELKQINDAEMRQMFHADIDALHNKLDALNLQLEDLEIEKDPLDNGNAIIEIRAGAGGDEASLFAQEMHRAYAKFAESHGLKVEIASVSYGTAGGFKEIIFFVNGHGAYGLLKFENGVHRVQRVPATESSGRIHTSAVSVVVLPESDDILVKIKEEDLRIDVYRSSGPGGQSVNTTDSAVRIVHLPTNITVTCQDEKSQYKNKAKALKILQAKLYDIEKQKQEEEQSKLRQSAIKSGDRSAKIRTYNFPQSRVTDHRIKESWHNLNEIMDGSFSSIIDALRQTEIQELKELIGK